MSREMAHSILQEIFEERVRLRYAPQSPQRLSKLVQCLPRAELVRLAAELVVCLEEVDQAQAPARAAEIRRRLEGFDQEDDVIRRPFGSRTA